VGWVLSIASAQSSGDTYRRRSDHKVGGSWWQLANKKESFLFGSIISSPTRLVPSRSRAHGLQMDP